MAIVSLTPSFREKLSMEQSERLQQSWARCIECLRYYEQQQNQSASSYLKSLEQLFPSGTGAHDTSGQSQHFQSVLHSILVPQCR